VSSTAGSLISSIAPSAADIVGDVHNAGNTVFNALGSFAAGQIGGALDQGFSDQTNSSGESGGGDAAAGQDTQNVDGTTGETAPIIPVQSEDLPALPPATGAGEDEQQGPYYTTAAPVAVGQIQVQDLPPSPGYENSLGYGTAASGATQQAPAASLGNSQNGDGLAPGEVAIPIEVVAGSDVAAGGGNPTNFSGQQSSALQSPQPGTTEDASSLDTANNGLAVTGSTADLIEHTSKAFGFTDFGSMVSKGSFLLGMAGIPVQFLGLANDLTTYQNDPNAVTAEVVKIDVGGAALQGSGYIVSGGSGLAVSSGLLAEGGTAATLLEAFPAFGAAFGGGVAVGAYLENHGIDLTEMYYNYKSKL